MTSTRAEQSWRDQLETDTVVGAETRASAEGIDALGLTILAHPNPARVGERAPLFARSASGRALVSRGEPYFAAPGSSERRPLADPYLSRTPLVLIREGEAGVRIDCSQTRTQVSIDGEEVGERELGEEELAQGVVLMLAQRHALLLHPMPGAPAESEERFGLIGHSPTMVQLQHELARVADLDVPVLLRGETGTGKELAARAIHEAGPRSGRPFLAVNMGAIPTTLAAAELFGAEKGAYTGAERRRIGHFEQCDGGTLLLDEIGEMPSEVQVMLLRALELKEVQPVGSDRVRRIDVRVIAATDADLRAAVGRGAFRAPLLHRLSGYEIDLPPLRSRREDVGRLLMHFLLEELEAVDETAKIDDPGPQGDPWLPAELVARLAVHPWPGNVRQLRNVARQLVIANRGSSRVTLTPQLERTLSEQPEASPPAAADSAASSVPKAGRTRTRYRDPDDVGDEELLAGLRAHEYRINQTAAYLGVSRTSLYARIDKSALVRKAADLDREEIEEARRRCGGSLDAMVERLEVSKKALKMRMKELGLR